MRDHFGDFDDVLFLHQFRRDVQSSFSYLELSVDSPDTAKRTVHYIFHGSKKGLIAIFHRVVCTPPRKTVFFITENRRYVSRKLSFVEFSEITEKI